MNCRRRRSRRNRTGTAITGTAVAVHFAAEAQIKFNRERIHGQSTALQSDIRKLTGYVGAIRVVDRVGIDRVGAATGDLSGCRRQWR